MAVQSETSPAGRPPTCAARSPPEGPETHHAARCGVDPIQWRHLLFSNVWPWPRQPSLTPSRVQFYSTGHVYLQLYSLFREYIKTILIHVAWKHADSVRSPTLNADPRRQVTNLTPRGRSPRFNRPVCGGLGHLGDLRGGTLVTWKGSGKTSCEVLTAADTMPLPMPVQESTVSCPGMVSCSRPPNGTTTASRAGCRGMVAVSLSYRPIPAQKPCHPAMP